MPDKTFILLENISFYAYHGVCSQEKKVGNVFIVNLKLKVDLTAAMESDDLSDTVSYADVHRLVSQEMDIPSNLLEHVCGRIVRRLFNEFKAIEEIQLKLCKQNPPMGADMDSAGVEVCCKR